MATIDIRRAHSFTDADVRSRAENLARTMQEKLGIRWSWQGDAIAFDVPGGAAKGASGKVSVGQHEVRVEIDLPFLLRPMKSVVEDKIKARLDSALGPS
jgi:putative polyhydroxyalkanoate system protein